MGALVWLASYPRSGNTWTRVFLHNLINILDGRGAQELNELDVHSTWDIAAHWYDPFLAAPPNRATKEAVAAARPLAQQRIADSVEGVVFVKTHAALIKDRGTPTVDMSRTAGAVYIVRNPLDIVLSYAKHMDVPVEEAVEVLNTPRFETPNGPHSVYEVYGSWSQHVESWTRRAHHAIHVLRYEDLIADPIRSFTGLARHLRIQASSENIEKASELSSFARLSAIEADKGFRERSEYSDRFFRSGTAGQWRAALPPSLVERVVFHHREVMRRFDYLM